MIGTTWEVIAQVAQGEKVPVKAILPDRGRHRLVGHLDDQRRRPKNPNCAYAWMSYITEPEAAVGGGAVLR